MAGPAYTRLDVDERRRRLLDLGADLFTRFAYDELSMARIAKEAGISKALLYHYFPSKEAYFVATLEEKAAELQRAHGAGPGAAAARAALGLARRLPELDRGERGQLRQDDPLLGRGARGAGAAGPRARRHGQAHRRRPQRGPAGRRPSCARRSAAGSGSWTAPAWTGSSTATSTARRCTACCSAPCMGAVLAAAARLRRADLLHVDDEHERLVRADRAASPAAP